METTVKNKPEQKKSAAKKKPAKGGFGMPQILIAVSIIITTAVLPIASDLVYNIITGFGESSNYLFTDIINILVPLATLAIYAACGYFAFKNLGGLLRFVGTAYVATTIAGILGTILSMPVKGITALIVETKAYLPYQHPNGMGMALGSVFTYLLDIIVAVIAAALGIFILMLITKKAPAAKKAPAQEDKK